MFALAASGFVFCKTIISDCDGNLWNCQKDSMVNNQNKDVPLFSNLPDTINSQEITKDNKPVTQKEFAQLKKAYHEMQAKYNILHEQNERVMQDTRQEVNNVINKTNGWLAFWIGVMSLVGVFIPLVLQFKFHSDSQKAQEKSENELKRLKDEHEKEKKEVEIRTKQMEAQFEQCEHNINLKVNKEITKINDIEFTTQVRIFQYIIENPEFRTNKYRYALLPPVWNDILKGFKRLINEFASSESIKHRHSSSYKLSMALVLISSVLNMIRSISARPIRSHNILSDRARDLIEELNSPVLDHSELTNALNSYLDSLQSLTLNFSR